MRVNCVVAVVIGMVVLSCASQPQYRDLPSVTSTAAASPFEVPDAFEARYRAASAAATLFHVRFDQRNYSRIFAAADDSFRAATTEAAFTARLAALRDRVGASRSEDELRVEIGERGQDLIITIVLETIFDNATLVETFTWRVTPTEQPFLVRYDTR